MGNKKSFIVIICIIVVLVVGLCFLGKEYLDLKRNSANQTTAEETPAGASYSDEAKIKQVIENAEQYRKVNDYDRAIATIDAALVSYPGSDLLIAKKETYVAEQKSLQGNKNTTAAEPKQTQSQPQSTPAPSEVKTNTKPADYTGEAPFYGIWCAAYKTQEEAQIGAEEYHQYGIDARIYLTTDWSNLNSQPWYVITAGVYPTKEAANAALPTIQSYYSGAYVKYSGEWRG